MSPLRILYFGWHLLEQYQEKLAEIGLSRVQEGRCDNREPEDALFPTSLKLIEIA